MNSVMSHSFSQVPAAEIPRSSFDRSHGHKTTFDAGYLIPVINDEVLPGDSLNLQMHALCRLATPIKPVMDNMFLESFFFFVPRRLIWTNWKKFNGEQTNPGDSTSYTEPQMTGPGGAGITLMSLSDYLGLPIGVAAVVFNSMYHRAYNLIYNEWFRDQNLQNSVVVDVDDGPDTYGDYSLLRRGKRHDYFTSCLPWPQKATAVTLPLGTSAEVWGSRTTNMTSANAPESPILLYQTNTAAALGVGPISPAEPDFIGVNAAGTGTAASAAAAYENVAFANKTLSQAFKGTATAPFIADLSTATSATINSLRQAFQLQRLYERDARGGTRYTEIVRAHFGVTSPDARLQRPEYLGGGSTRIDINGVPQTAPQQAAGVVTPQGNMAAFGVAGVSGHGFTKSFTEHGVLLGLVSVRADLTYQNRLDRSFSRRTRFDHYWPALSHIGEQAVLNSEIYCDMTANDALTFGYQERYGEYRYKPSQITGQFRSNAAGTLDVWHLSEDFATLPVLNASFIVDNPPIDRVIAVATEPHFIGDFYFDYKCARPMPVYSVPGMIDHF